MVTVKMLKPYYIKMNSEYIKVIFAYQYFSLLIDKQVYHFVPIEGREILINRQSKRIVNIESKFAFRKGKEIIYITVKKLTTLLDFMRQIEELIEPYYVYGNKGNISELSIKNTELITELELENVKRLIDLSLDEKNEDDFNELIKLL